MFTGIVEELGQIVSKDQLADAARFVIRDRWSRLMPATVTRLRSTGCV